MTGALRHIRHNVVAYLALFVALGGTSYAAITINVPAGSVGERQIKNHVIDPVKFNPRYIGGSVRHWAVVNAQLQVLASSSNAQVGRHLTGVQVSWGGSFPAHCAAIADVQQGGFDELPPVGYATAGVIPQAGWAVVTTHDAQGNTTPEPFTVVVIC